MLETQTISIRPDLSLKAVTILNGHTLFKIIRTHDTVWTAELGNTLVWHVWLGP